MRAAARGGALRVRVLGRGGVRRGGAPADAGDVDEAAGLAVRCDEAVCGVLPVLLPPGPRPGLCGATLLERVRPAPGPARRGGRRGVVLEPDPDRQCSDDL